MVDQVDNKSSLEADKVIELVTAFFSQEFPYFELIKKFNHGKYIGSGCEYKWENILVFVGSERGGLDYRIFVNGDQVSLLKFDARVKNLYAASASNFHIFFNVLATYLNSLK